MAIARVIPGLVPLLAGINLLALISCAIQLSIPFLFGRSFSALFSNGHSDAWMRNIYLLLGVGALSAVFSGVESRFALHLRHRSVMFLEMRACKALLEKPILEVRARESGQLASHLNSDILAAADLIGLQASLARICVLTLGSLLIIAGLNLLVAVFVFLISMIYFLIIVQVTPKVADAYKQASGETAKSSSYVHQLIDAALDIRVFGSHQFFEHNYSIRVRAKADAMVTAGRLSKRIDQSVYIVQLLGSFVILAASTKYFGSGKLEMSGVLAAMGVLAFFWSSLRTGVTQFLNAQKNLPLIQRLQEWLQSTTPTHLPFGDVCPCDSPRRPSAISFRNVSFQFPGGGRDVLSNISFDIARGERVLLTGDNGAGKTTLMFLMLGVIEPTSGAVLLDGVPCQQIEEQVLRRLILRVAHDGYIFPMSVEGNVIFGREPEPLASSISAAMSVSGCEEIAGATEVGADVGERGSRLSAGQRQRILIARALAGDARILLLDEATASIDAESTRVIYEKLLLDHQRHQKTLVVTAHHSDFLASMVDRHFHLIDGHLHEARILVAVHD